jgi:SAM-dependent methyltransferase
MKIRKYEFKWDNSYVADYIRRKMPKPIKDLLRPMVRIIRHFSYFLIRIQRKRRFKRHYASFKRMSAGDERFSIDWADRYPCLEDDTQKTSFSRHYIYHTAWAARKVFEISPEWHADIGSALYFSSILSAFRPVHFYDYRPPLLSLDNLTVGHANLMSLDFPDDSIPSLSCMHVVEHIGLGRYGDPIDPDGDLKAISELKRVLALNGNLLFVVPVGQPKIKFNAHRIYSVDQVLEYFGDLNLKEFNLIPEDARDGGLIGNPDKRLVAKQSYACGCFWFKRGKY